jgi:hypothetical protein
MSAPIRDCVICKHWSDGETGWISSSDVSEVFRIIVVNGSGFWHACAMHHQPRFYHSDGSRGWKRRCEEFEPRGEENER